MKATRKRKTARKGTKLRSLGDAKVVKGGRRGTRRARLRSLGDATKVVGQSRRTGAAKRAPA